MSPAFHLWPLRPLDSALMFFCALPPPPPRPRLQHQSSGSKITQLLALSLLPQSSRSLQPPPEPDSSQSLTIKALGIQCIDFLRKFAVFLGVYYFSLPAVRCVCFFSGCPLPTPPRHPHICHVWQRISLPMCLCVCIDISDIV